MSDPAAPFDPHEPAFAARAMEDLKRLTADRTPVVLELSRAEAWILMSTLQLALRHPRVREMVVSEAIRALAERLVDAVPNTPTLQRLAAAGWEEQSDAP